MFVAFSNTVLAYYSILEASVNGGGTKPTALRSVLDRLQRIDHIPYPFSTVTHP